MKEAVFVLMTLCFLAGCAETGEQKSPAKAKRHGFKGFPIELQVPSDEALAVRVKAQDDKAIPVKLDMRGGEPLRVDVNIPGDKGLPVRLDMEGGKGLLVEVKLPRAALVFMAVGAAAILLISIVTCFAAIGAARSAKAAYQSADAIKKVQQQSKSDLHTTNED
ncbi:hypothetical protein ES703_78016 [subsurface metagenome]